MSDTAQTLLLEDELKKILDQLQQEENHAVETTPSRPSAEEVRRRREARELRLQRMPELPPVPDFGEDEQTDGTENIQRQAEAERQNQREEAEQKEMRNRKPNRPFAEPCHRRIRNPDGGNLVEEKICPSTPRRKRRTLHEEETDETDTININGEKYIIIKDEADLLRNWQAEAELQKAAKEPGNS